MSATAGGGGTDRVLRRAFISYVHEDSLQVDRLQHRLEGAGVQVWRDRANLWPGEDWRAEIRRAIRDDALVFIACFSDQSIARSRSYQNEELTLAIEELRLRRPGNPWLIPVRFSNCKLPDIYIGMGRTLSSIQCADLFGDHEQENTARLVMAVRRAIGSAVNHSATPISDYIAEEDRLVTNSDLIEDLEDRSRYAAADSEHMDAMAPLKSAWRLLMQAPHHQLILLGPSHPNAADIAEMGSWIEGCGRALHNAQGTRHSDETALIEEILERLAVIADAFHMYSSILERSRRTDERTAELQLQSRLSTVADDERTLLNCHWELRRSIQALIAILQEDI